MCFDGLDQWDEEWQLLELKHHITLDIENKHYEKAFLRIQELSRQSYIRNKDFIEDCIITCAKHEVVEAMIFMADRYTESDAGKIKPEAFPYLRDLANRGYVKAFRRLGDCYRQGIGCPVNLNMANKAYFEGLIFSFDDICARMLRKSYRHLENYNGDDLVKTIFAEAIWDEGVGLEMAQTKIAKMIIDGEIKDYKPDTVRTLLAKHVLGYNDIANAIMAEYVLIGKDDIFKYALAEELLDGFIHPWPITDEDLEDLVDPSKLFDKESLAKLRREAVDRYYEVKKMIKELGHGDISAEDLEDRVNEWVLEEPQFMSRRGSIYE